MDKPEVPPPVFASSSLRGEERDRALRERLGSYCPGCLTSAEWEPWRASVVGLVMECRPTNGFAAIRLARSLAELICGQRPALGTAWVDVLSASTIERDVQRLSLTLKPPSLAQRRSTLRALQATALGLPHIQRGGGNASLPEGHLVTAGEFVDLWMLFGTAPELICSALRHRLAVGVAAGVTGAAARNLAVLSVDGVPVVLRPDGSTVAVPQPWAGPVADLVLHPATAVDHNPEAVKRWLASRHVQLGYTRMRDTYLAAAWQAASPTVDLLVATRSTSRDIERLAPLLPLPSGDVERAALRGHRPPDRTAVFTETHLQK